MVCAIEVEGALNFLVLVFILFRFQRHEHTARVHHPVPGGVWAASHTPHTPRIRTLPTLGVWSSCTCSTPAKFTKLCVLLRLVKVPFSISAPASTNDPYLIISTLLSPPYREGKVPVAECAVGWLCIFNILFWACTRAGIRFCSSCFLVSEVTRSSRAPSPTASPLDGLPPLPAARHVLAPRGQPHDKHREMHDHEPHGLRAPPPPPPVFTPSTLPTAWTLSFLLFLPTTTCSAWLLERARC